MRPVEEIVIRVRPDKKRFKRLTERFKRDLNEKGFESVEVEISYAS